MKKDTVRKKFDTGALFISSNVDVKLCLILGLSDDALLLCDPLLPIFDVYCKLFLKRAWHARSTIKICESYYHDYYPLV